MALIQRPASASQVREALLATAGIGEFFRLEVCDGPDRAGWRPAAEVCRDGLAGLIASTAAQLRTGDVRVAASIAHLGLAERLWSPVLGCGLLCGIVPDLSTLVMTAGSGTRLGVTSLSGWTAAAPDPLATLVAESVGGNSASAMAGALVVLVRARPGLASSATALGHALLRTEGLRDAGVLADAGPGRVADHAGPAGATQPRPAALAFRRRSCCLYYRVPGGRLCGDCCLTRRPGTPP